MSLVPIQTLPDSARTWIFAADRSLTPAESEELTTLLNAYLERWKAHGAPVRAGQDTRYGRFLVIAADPDVTAPSGCSIDDMTRAIQSLGEEFGVDFFNPMNVFYKEGENVEMASRSEFKKLAQQGTVTPETTVFDNAITSLADLRSGNWETAASRTWHAKAFFPSVAAA